MSASRLFSGEVCIDAIPLIGLDRVSDEDHKPVRAVSDTEDLL